MVNNEIVTFSRLTAVNRSYPRVLTSGIFQPQLQHCALHLATIVYVSLAMWFELSQYCYMFPLPVLLQHVSSSSVVFQYQVFQHCKAHVPHCVSVLQDRSRGARSVPLALFRRPFQHSCRTTAARGLSTPSSVTPSSWLAPQRCKQKTTRGRWGFLQLSFLGV